MGTYLLRLLVIMALLLPVYALLRWWYARRRGLPRNTLREVLLALFVVFMGALLTLVLWPPRIMASPAEMWASVTRRVSTGQGINLVPLRSIRLYLRALAGGHVNAFGINVVGNVLMFVPVGLCLPLFWRWWQSFWKILAVAFLFPVCIETAQLFIGRNVDVDDVLLNALGVVLGWLLYKLLAGKNGFER